MADEVRVRLEDVLGYVRLTIPPIVYGEQPQPSLYERFNRAGQLVEQRIVPPVIRIHYHTPPVPIWRQWWTRLRRMRHG